ncbi:PAAR domain-containing protein (plasmid) [Clostridium botulinum]|uniref:Uncharacterized protein n=1 Tax=Clostridium botulinum C/D str. DC5 TaxID=1443128 RepID=A0A0A0HVY7_CLOBO|nr:PAAR domain-containing protein [Clostridium botulinum]KGM93324.1 hypothetical protein Z955_15210 [Clostridium botulinum C/D str. DC5]MCD3234806.1 hypothetical protein [Clostridium botulinum D/C]MCD3240959.1 hypothetical protein [Clostridium botulinum D/C]MCD3268180.1 hypothetical protein [Clostridium botulinum D/C]MCD3301151.1 hypothetical protein [Clostridium botulinum D/C]
MGKAIARVGDKVEGTCYGEYRRNKKTRSESGTFTGEIVSGSSIIFEKGKPIARVGDIVKIHKHYPHSGHYDSLETTAIIKQGSFIMFEKGKGIAYVGCSVSGDDLEGKIVSGSDNLFISK